MQYLSLSHIVKLYDLCLQTQYWSDQDDTRPVSGVSDLLSGGCSWSRTASQGKWMTAMITVL